MAEITAGGPGYVAVGSEGVGSQSFHEDAVVWVSPDGLTWERLHDDEAFGGEGYQKMLAVTTAPDGRLLAVGYELWEGELDPAIWISGF